MLRTALLAFVGVAVAGVAVVGVTAGLAAPEAHAETCLPAGDAELPSLEELIEAEDGELRFAGRGRGHGVGMSQYGALGAAALGCDYEEILTTYYDAEVSSVDTDAAVAVGLTREGGGTDITHPHLEVEVMGEAPLAWYVRDGDDREELAEQPVGARWRVEVAADEPDDEDDPEQWAFVLRDADGEEVASAGGEGARLRAHLDETLVRLPDKTFGTRFTDGVRYDRGVLSLTSRGDGDRPLQARLLLPDVETYLYGLAEVPGSWPEAALRAQAVAGRSFTLASGNVPYELVDTENAQVYAGYEQGQSAGWRAAVDDTAGEALTRDGSVVSGFYSASAGGATASSELVWGGVHPHVVGVDASRWELHGLEEVGPSWAPDIAWAASFTTDEAERVLNDAAVDEFGTLLDVEIDEPRGLLGRAGRPSDGRGGVVFTGTQDVLRLDGLRVRSLFGLDAAPFEAAFEAAPEPCMPPPEAGPLERVDRLAGDDRVETAAEVAREFEAASEVVVASARDFPDALAGGALAADLEGPLLLTEPGELSTPVAETIAALDTERVTVLGGEAAVSADVTDALDGLSGVEEVERVGGEDRFGTAAQIAQRVGVAGGEVALALGQAPASPQAAPWPDAVAAGALLAGDTAPPLLLTRGEVLPEATLEALADLAPDRVRLLGGPAAIAESVEEALEDAGYEVDRLAGDDRWGTSAAVLDAALAGGASPEGLILATGEAFPDALAAGALAAARGEPLALVPHCDLDDASAIAEAIEGGLATRAVVVGGDAAVSARVAWQVDGFLNR